MIMTLWPLPASGSSALERSAFAAAKTAERSARIWDDLEAATDGAAKAARETPLREALRAENAEEDAFAVALARFAEARFAVVVTFTPDDRTGRRREEARASDRARDGEQSEKE
jgi:hypothetical protein